MKQINQMTAIEDNSIKFDASNIYEVNITRVFAYSKLRKCIYGYIGVKDFCNLGLVNKRMNFVCSKTWKRQFISALLANKESLIEGLRKDYKEYEKIFDAFPAYNIRVNAIKYLFFKIKPAAYMLPFFQEEEPVVEKAKVEEKLKLPSFFRKKPELQISK